MKISMKSPFSHVFSPFFPGVTTGAALSVALPGPRDAVRVRAARGRRRLDRGPRPDRGVSHAAAWQRAEGGGFESSGCNL